MSPESLEQVFIMYPEVKLVVLAHRSGTSGKIDEIKTICQTHRALLVENATEPFGATYKGVQTGYSDDYVIISFNGNNIFKTVGDADFCNKVMCYLKTL